MTKFLFTILFLKFSFASQLSLENINDVLINFLLEKNKTNLSVSNIQTFDDNKDSTIIYIVNLNPKGFVILSGSKKSRPILGYSFANNIDSNDLPTQLDFIIKSYIRGIEYLIENDIPPDQENLNLYKQYLDGSFNNSILNRSIAPLISANWNQGGEWNDYCPNNSLVGCVAVAMGQIMNYWNHPTQGYGYSQYYDQNHGIIGVNFEDYNYNFQNMYDNYATEDSQLLLYHSGVAVQMSYSQWASGASVCWEGPSAQHALDNHFRYNDDITCEVKINYSEDDWELLIKDQLDRGWPIIYRGYSDDSGHAWNIDGYEDSFYHCNWGWGGSSNGYFYFDNLNGGGYNFIDNQAALLNIIPDDILAPEALFDFNINELLVEFNDLSFIVNSDDIISWNWSFGDGNISSEQSPIHTYQDYGEYQVSLTVQNSYGLDSFPHLENIVIANYFGDINEDFSINVLDIIDLLNFILANELSNSLDYDLNFDSTINILDIIILIQLIIN